LGKSTLIFTWRWEVPFWAFRFYFFHSKKKRRWFWGPALLLSIVPGLAFLSALPFAILRSGLITTWGPILLLNIMIYGFFGHPRLFLPLKKTAGPDSRSFEFKPCASRELGLAHSCGLIQNFQWGSIAFSISLFGNDAVPVAAISDSLWPFKPLDVCPPPSSSFGRHAQVNYDIKTRAAGGPSFLLSQSWF